MWQNNINMMLYRSGWGIGLRLPIANEENMALERELEKRQRMIELRRAELDDINKHTEIIEKGFRNASEHITHDTKILRAKTSEIAAESDLLQAVEREVRELGAECKLVEAKFKKAVTLNRNLVRELQIKKHDVCDLADLIEFDRKELAVIEKRAADETQVLKAIEEIGDQDSVTLRNYETRYRKATAETSLMRIDLDGKVAVTRMMQADFDGLSERFKKLHKERGDILSFWRETLAALTEKDEEMQDIADEYAFVDHSMKEMNSKYDEINRVLNEREKIATIAFHQLDKWDRKIADVKLEIMSTQEITTCLKDSIFSHETSIASASKEIQDYHGRINKADKELEELNYKIAEAEGAVSSLQIRDEVAADNIFTVADRIQQIQDLVDEEVRRAECLEKCLETELIKKNQWMNLKGNLGNKSLGVEYDIQSVFSNLQSLLIRTRDTKMELEKKKAMIYRVELQFINAQLKYLPTTQSAQQDPIGYQEKEARRLELRADADTLVKQKKFIAAQTERLIHVYERIGREIFASQKDMGTLELQNNEHRSFVVSSEKNLDLMVGEYQNAVVDLSLLKLKRSQLMRALKATKDSLYDSGSQRIILETTVKEKRQEIDAHGQLLEMRRRAVNEDLSQLRRQRHQVEKCVAARKIRYDIIINLMGRKEDAEMDKGDNSEAYYVLKMAHEREVLMMEVQRWEHRIAEVEKELEGMKNVQLIMNASNTSLKDSLAPAGEDSEEVKALDKLNAQEQEVLIRRTRAKKYRVLLRDKMYETEQRSAIVEQEIRATIHFSEMKEALATKIQNELQRQREKINRWRGMCNKVLKEIKPLYPEDEFYMLELDLKLRFTASKYENGVSMFERVLSQHPHVKKYFIQRLQEDSNMLKLYDRFSRSLSTIHSRSSSSSGSSRMSSHKLQPSSVNLSRIGRLSSDSESSSARTYRSLRTPKKNIVL